MKAKVPTVGNGEQLELLMPGDRVAHPGGERGTVADDQQTPVLEYLHGAETVYVNLDHLPFQRVPFFRCTLSRVAS